MRFWMRSKRGPRMDEMSGARAFLRRPLRTALLLPALLIPLSGCARGREEAGLSAVTFNYSADEIVFVRIGGKQAGVGIEAAKLGDVEGGGVMCCVSVPLHEAGIPVEVQTVSGTYMATAVIELPWPTYAHYAIVHVLPQRKIVIEVAATDVWPRQDLLNARLKELGVSREVEYAGVMNVGPWTSDK